MYHISNRSRVNLGCVSVFPFPVPNRMSFQVTIDLGPSKQT